MSISATRRINTGGYTSPFSGVGAEFFPLGLASDLSGVVIHEVGHLTRNVNWNFPSMFSPYWRLIYDWRPGHKLVFPEREVRLGPECLVLNPDHIRCDFREISPVPTTWIHFTCERRPINTQPVPIRLRPGKAERELLKELARVFTSRKPAPRRRVFSLSLALLQVVLSRPELRWLEETPEGINRVTQHIREHFADPLYNPVLARKAGLSVRSLTRLFAQHQGVSLARFVAQVRVREVAHLLASSALSLDEIAVRTGFPNAAYLSRVFKQFTGDAPVVFRRVRRLEA